MCPCRTGARLHARARRELTVRRLPERSRARSAVGLQPSGARDAAIRRVLSRSFIWLRRRRRQPSPSARRLIADDMAQARPVLVVAERARRTRHPVGLPWAGRASGCSGGSALGRTCASPGPGHGPGHGVRSSRARGDGEFNVAVTLSSRVDCVFPALGELDHMLARFAVCTARRRLCDRRGPRLLELLSLAWPCRPRRDASRTTHQPAAGTGGRAALKKRLAIRAGSLT